jgi:peptidoglycan/LPS O-acetylase OafA/YrhL
MAWWVVVGHALHLAGVSSNLAESLFSELVLKVLMRGNTAVSVFIIISGFVIAHLLLIKRENYGRYLIRRWLRIFPVFLVCLIIALLLTPMYEAAYTGFEWVHQREMRLSRIALLQQFWIASSLFGEPIQSQYKPPHTSALIKVR